MDEAPGVADRELILSGMLVCSTAAGQTLQRIIVEERLVVPSQIFRWRSSCTTTNRGEAERLRLLPRSLTELYTTETGPPWKAAFRLSRHSPGVRLGHVRIGREPDNQAPAIT
jgi:hypothetical protein